MIALRTIPNERVLNLVLLALDDRRAWASKCVVLGCAFPAMLRGGRAEERSIGKSFRSTLAVAKCWSFPDLMNGAIRTCTSKINDQTASFEIIRSSS